MSGQGWLQVGELTLAFALSGPVGVEREIRQKSAGLRTHCLVGVASALFMLVSKYGFDDVLRARIVVLDPSRVAAQIVSGIGFIGAGVIFMRRDVVRGLTTAASIWLTAALGMACGAGLVLLAIATTIGHFIIMLGLPKLIDLLPRPRGDLARHREAALLRISYADGRGLLRKILIACTEMRFAVSEVRLDETADLSASAEDAIDLADDERSDADPPPGRRAVSLILGVKGKRPVTDLMARLGEINGVHEVATAERDLPLE